MVDLSILGSLSGLSKTFKEYYEFWSDYKGEEILIREHTVQAGGERRPMIEQNTYVIRGTVSDVSSFPPGFLLTDVEEYIEMSDVSLSFTVDSVEPVDSVEGVHARETLRELEEKYVSFSSIEQIERAEVAEKSVEPFREDS